MNQISNTYRFISLFLAMLMFLTSVVFTVDMHYCGGELKSFSLFGEATPCYELAGGETAIKCPNHNKMAQKMDTEGVSMDKKSCCENKSFEFHSELDQQEQAASLAFTPHIQQFIIAYALIFCTKSASLNKVTTPFLTYLSPQIARDIPVLNKAFLL